jgi:hypothetical protein
MPRGPFLAVAIALGLSATAPCAANLAPVPQRRAHLSAAAKPFHPRPFGPHRIYAQIVAIQGSLLTVRRRNGRLQKVDDTVAVNDNAYSMPLFVGKCVVIDGTVTKGVMSAAHIFRIPDLNGDNPDS